MFQSKRAVPRMVGTKSGHRQRYEKLGLKSISLRCPPELKLPRQTLHYLLAMRSGHGDFEGYHLKHDHKDPTRCTFKRPKTIEHIVYCRKTTQLRDKWPTPYEHWLRLISSPKDFQYFSAGHPLLRRDLPAGPKVTSRKLIIHTSVIHSRPVFTNSIHTSSSFLFKHS